MNRPTFAGWKRRIGIGTKLLCVEQTHRPELVGETRIVNKVMTVGIRTDPDFYTTWPKAQHVTMLDENTARWPIRQDTPDKIVALRIVEDSRI